jgi:hypothetical protein
MKAKLLLCGVVFIVVVLAGVGSFANDKEKYGFYIPGEYEEIFGSWVNNEFKGTSAIVDKWTDSQGNIWYKSYDRDPDTRRAYLCLYKISADKAVLESVWSYTDSPAEDDLNSKNPDFYYRIYYRR